jgi:hypothetical protein
MAFTTLAAKSGAAVSRIPAMRGMLRKQLVMYFLSLLLFIASFFNTFSFAVWF